MEVVEVVVEAQLRIAVHSEISQEISTTISVQHQRAEQELQVLEPLLHEL